MHKSDWDSRLNAILSQREDLQDEKIHVYLSCDETGAYIKKFIDSHQSGVGFDACEVILVSPDRPEDTPESLLGCPAVKLFNGDVLYSFDAIFKIKEVLDPMTVISKSHMDEIKRISEHEKDDINILQMIIPLN